MELLKDGKMGKLKDKEKKFTQAETDIYWYLVVYSNPPQ